MHDIGVDPYGINIMLPKSASFLIYLKEISNVTANIIKQEMLSLGGDTAVSKGALTGKTRKTGCLIIGTLNQLQLLARKLKTQPFGLNKVAAELTQNIKNFSTNDFTLRLGSHVLKLGQRTHIMGIINLTPDSFSGDGLYRVKSKDYLQLALAKAEEMVEEGADILDLGGQSSRPGAKNIPLKEEIKRTLPVVELLVKKIKAPISIDTTRPEVAKAALDAGAQMINDISGMRNHRLIKVAAKANASVVIMHMLGKPQNMQKIIAYQSLIDDICAYLRTCVNHAESEGINPEKILVDPGIGFGKTPKHNLEIIKRLSDFKVLGKPLLLGPSRKSFIAKILGEELQPRIQGTAAACVMAAERGAHILRVHDVKEVNQALKIFTAVTQNCNG